MQRGYSSPSGVDFMPSGQNRSRSRPSDIYRRAIRIYGASYQMFKLREECIELLLAMTHYEDSRGQLDKVIEEVADVLITAEQARLILGPEKVDEVRQQKLQRLVARMDAT